MRLRLDIAALVGSVVGLAIAVIALAATCGKAPVPQIAGLSANNLGCAYVGTYNIQCERASDTQLLASDAAATLTMYGAPTLTLGNGEAAEFSALVHASIQGCDGSATCGCDIRRYFPGTMNGGVFARGDGVTVDVPVDSYCGFTAAAQLQVSDAGVAGVSVLCGPACYAAGSISSRYTLPYDAATPDSGGGAPTITSLSPPIGVNGGGNTIAMVGTNLTGATAVTCNGNAVSPSSVTATTLNFVAPAYGGSANGTGNVSVGCTVTTPGGTSTASNFYYYPTTLVQWVFGGVAQSVSAWTDQTGNGNSFAQATGGRQPTLTANWNGSGRQAATFTGPTEFYAGTLAATAQPVTASLVGNAASNSTQQVIMDGAADQIYLNFGGTPNSMYVGFFLTQAIATADVIQVVYNGASSAAVIDGTTHSGTIAAGSLTGPNIGALGNATNGITGNIAEYCTYNSALGATALTNDQQIKKAVWGTP
jgi:IPT/TIG domain